MSGTDKSSGSNGSFNDKVDTIGSFGEGVPDSGDAVADGNPQGVSTLTPAPTAQVTSDPGSTSQINDTPSSGKRFGRARAMSTDLIPSFAGKCAKSGFLPRMVTRRGSESNLNVSQGMTEGDVDWLETMLPGVTPLSGLTG